VRLTVARPDLIPDPAASHQPVHRGDDAVLVRVQTEGRLAQGLESGPALGGSVAVSTVAGRHPLQQ
jgi:hypothetical protein